MEAVRAFFWLEALRLNRGKKHPVRTVAFDLRLLTFFFQKGSKGQLANDRSVGEGER